MDSNILEKKSTHTLILAVLIVVVVVGLTVMVGNSNQETRRETIRKENKIRYYEKLANFQCVEMRNGTICSFCDVRNGNLFYWRNGNFTQIVRLGCPVSKSPNNHIEYGWMNMGHATAPYSQGE